MKATSASESGPYRILAVDDDVEVLELLERTLLPPEFSLLVATTGQQAIDLCAAEDPDVVVLDVGLPDIVGTEVARRIRDAGFQNPILMLTAMDAEADVIEGLESGAAAYLTKPFRLGEVAAWIRAVLRTAREAATDGPPRGGHLELDVDRRRVRRTDDGREVRLTPTETLLLGTLLRAGGDLVNRETLLREVWEMDFEPGTTLVEVHLSNLRGKLRRLDADDAVENVRGEGYRFDAERT